MEELLQNPSQTDTPHPQENDLPGEMTASQEAAEEGAGQPQAPSSAVQQALPETAQACAAPQAQPADEEPRRAANAVPSDNHSAQDAPQTDKAALLESDEAKQIIENLLFITDRPLKPSRIAEVVETVNAKRVLEIIDELAKEYADTGRAIRILEIGGGYQMCTKPEYGRWVRRLYNEKMTTRLSNAALETLAIIAYKQPVTRAEMEMIRGVDVAAPLERLLERGLVRVLGKRDTIGRPMVYGTTDEFLRLFGLNKISELPDLQVFAAKQLQNKQEDLPFDEKLPPLAEPAILALEEETGDAADAFFKRPKNMFEQEEPAAEKVSDSAELAAALDTESGPEMAASAQATDRLSEEPAPQRQSQEPLPPDPAVQDTASEPAAGPDLKQEEEA